MPFTSYSSIGDVARAHQITLLQANFVVPVPRPVSAGFLADLDFSLQNVGVTLSEYALCENLIYPILREVWRSYLEHLIIFSHIPLVYDADLCGTPDYVVTRRSPLGVYLVEEPYLVVVEAKRDDFTAGWGQCLAAMLAAQKTNEAAGKTVYGITTNGRTWEIGKLEDATFTEERGAFTIRDVDGLCAALHYVFEQCQLQVIGQVCPA